MVVRYMNRIDQILSFSYCHKKIHFGELTMTDINGIEVVEGDKLEIMGRTYILDLDHSLAGDFVVWSDEKSFLRIYATPNFDGMIGVPVQIDYDSYNITADCFEGEIDSYEHYKRIVKEIAEKLLANLPACTCAEQLGTKVPIILKGWGMYQCRQCGGILKENQDMLKKEEVVEELNQTVDKYFEEMSQKLGLKSGDMSPEQSFAIDEAVEKLADIVVKWAEQNQEIKEKKEYGNEKKDNRPRVSLAGKDGNVFAVIGIISEKLNKSGLKDMANEFSEKALASDSYEDVIELALNYVKIDEIPNR